MEIGEEFGIFGSEWARIHFIENPGMAFGISFGGEFGKLLLSLFRLIAIGFLLYLMEKLIKAGEPFGLLACLSLIIAGATGNIIDSAFYGLIFSYSPMHGGVATLFPEGGGYASFLHGKVVDMLYFPLIDTSWPEWMPWLGGGRFQFFRPVFNIADASITVGVISILLFYRGFFRKETEQGTEENKGKTVLGWAGEEE